MNTREPPSKLWLLLILLGLGLRWLTPVLYPIHEQMHAEMVGLTGGTVTSRTFNHITWTGGNHTAILFFGSHGELWLYAIGALIFKRIGLGFYGVVMFVGPDAIGSRDFDKLGGGFLVLHLVVWVVLLVVIGVITHRRYASEDVQGEPKKSYGPIRSPLRQ